MGILSPSYPQKKDTLKYKELQDYSFILADYPNLQSSMRANNNNYSSFYSLLSNTLRSNFNDRKTNAVLFLASFFTLPLSHEEGHRSILTEQGIGSISDPFFNKFGAAYVKGVRDMELNTLRNQNLPTFIRLHTAGLESDYMLIKRVQTAVLLENTSFQTYKPEYITRNYSLISYYFTSMFKFLAPKLKEEANELERDIVGHDVYGAVRHLHRPDMPFFRYTNYDDLTAIEQKYIRRVGFSSLINLIQPMIFGITDVSISKELHLSVGAGYTMIPFGDMYEVNTWIRKNNKIKLQNSLKFYNNLNRTFLGIGTKLVKYPLKKSFLNAELQIWNQPEKLNGVTTKGKYGGMIDLMFSFPLFSTSGKFVESCNLDVSIISKTKGFVLEEVNLKNFTGFRFGTTIRIKK